MSRDSINRLIALGTSVTGGLVVRLIVNNPLLALSTFISILLVWLLVLGRGFPVVIAFDSGLRKKLGYKTLYNNQEAASDVIVAATHATRRLDIMVIRGFTFILDQQSLLTRMVAGTQNLKIRILLLNSSGEAMEKYLRKMKFPPDDRTEYLQRCALVEHRLQALTKTYDLAFAYYDFFPSWKLVVTDSTLFVAAYDTTNRGSVLPIAAYHDMGRAYFIAFSGYFEQTWNSIVKQG